MTVEERVKKVIEEQLSVNPEQPDEEAEKITKVGEAIDYIKAHLQE